MNSQGYHHISKPLSCRNEASSVNSNCFFYSLPCICYLEHCLTDRLLLSKVWQHESVINMLTLSTTMELAVSDNTIVLVLSFELDGNCYDQLNNNIWSSNWLKGRWCMHSGLIVMCTHDCPISPLKWHHPKSWPLRPILGSWGISGKKTQEISLETHMWINKSFAVSFANLARYRKRF